MSVPGAAGPGAGFEAQIVFLGTLDLTGTSEFYEQILGLPLVLDFADPNGYRLEIQRFDDPRLN